MDLEHIRQIWDEERTEKARADLGRALRRRGKKLAARERFEDALPLAREAVQIWTELGRTRARFLGRLELAEVLAGLGEHEAAEARFDELAAELDEDPDQLGCYEDFWCEARAHQLAACGDPLRAAELVRRALALRRARGNARHIAQTEQLLASLTSSGALS